MDQKKLEELLKKKGIGPLGSKSLNTEEVDLVRSSFLVENISLTTKATMLTALLTLEQNSDEAALISNLKSSPGKFLPTELLPYITHETENPFLILINKIISKQDLSEGEASQAMNYFFSEEFPEYMKASFLEAERLKRETFTENQAFFKAMWDKSRRKEVEEIVLIHLCDSFDGSNRTRNYSVFVASLLAAAGFKCILTGIDQVAPKQGITAHQILSHAGKNPLCSFHEAIDELHHLGWTYLDQKIFLPELYKLKDMRKEMVKRPFLATFEKLLQPVRSLEENYIVTGYTHTHYREELVKQLKAQGKTSKAVILKGMEGNTHLSMTKESVCVQLSGEIITDSTVSPSHYGLAAMEEKQDKGITINESLEEGLAALGDERNYARENILYLSAVILDKFNLCNKHDIIPMMNSFIQNGDALRKFQQKT